MAAVPRLATERSDALAAAQAVNDFGLDLYRVVAGRELADDNAVVSPASVALALAMARAGARGATASEMDAVLRRFGADETAAWPAALDEAFAERTQTLRGPDGTPVEVTLRIANAPFSQRGMPLEPAFLEALGARFGAGLRLVDYIGATEAARRTINDWVAGQTEQRIPELLGPGLLTPDSRLTLVNAIYLKAPWATPFAAEATAPAPFTRPDGSLVDVPTMATRATLEYASGTGWRAVEIPYVSGQLAMIVIVPDDLAAFEAELDAGSLEAIVAALEDRPVNLALPRFSIETKASLADALRALGMPLAFDPARADFSGITAAEALVVDEVVHQANIDVDEKGTEAAAATAAVMRATSADREEPVTFRADRPFLFALRDVPTGAVLFLGRVTDPSIGR
jgi:serpin B